MNAFIFQLPNRPGELARVTEALAARRINLLVYDLGPGDEAGIAFVASDEETTRSTLGELGVVFREIPVLTVRMEDKPGQAASTSRRLADAGGEHRTVAPGRYQPGGLHRRLGRRQHCNGPEGGERAARRLEIRLARSLLGHPSGTATTRRRAGTSLGFASSVQPWRSHNQQRRK